MTPIVYAILVLYEGKRLGWKAAVSRTRPEHLSDRYFHGVHRSACTVLEREFSASDSDAAWNQAREWLAGPMKHPLAGEGFDP